jgi:hypothetical protein
MMGNARLCTAQTEREIDDQQFLPPAVRREYAQEPSLTVSRIDLQEAHPSGVA